MKTNLTHEEYVKTLPVITYNDFIEKDKTEDLCFEIDDGKISDDLEDYFCEQMEYVNTKEEVENAINNSCIEVMKKERYKLPKGYLIQTVQDYLEDNFGYDPYELGYLDDMMGSEVFEEMENKINNFIKDWYTSGEAVYQMDIAKETEEYLKDELGEDYPL